MELMNAVKYSIQIKNILCRRAQYFKVNGSFIDFHFEWATVMVI